MLRLNPGPLVFVLFFCALGCNREVDLSPDGKTVVITTGSDITFKDVNGKKLGATIKADGVSSPRFSPDGKMIVVEQQDNPPGQGRRKAAYVMPPIRTLFVAKNGPILFSIPGIGGPYAWKPDGTEVVGTDRNSAVVMHVGSRQIVRRYALPAEPTTITWCGDGRDLAIGGESNLMVVHGGAVKSRAISGPVKELSFDSVGGKLVWLESRSNSTTDTSPEVAISVHSIDLGLTTPVEVIRETSGTELMGSKGRQAMPISTTISPDGTQLAIAGIVDASPPGVMDRFLRLQKLQQHTPSNATQIALKKLEKQIVLNATCTTTALLPGPHPTKLRYSQNAYTLDVTSHWTGPGHDLCVVVDDKVHRVPTSP